jgi:hypothetical protein
VNLVAVVPGASEQLFVLVAPYDTRSFDGFRFVGANDGASAPALLLELARVIQARPLAYTTWFVFLDREAPPAGDPDPAANPVLGGSTVLAQDLVVKGDKSSVRLVVAFHQVGDADLRIARDLRSHRLFREEFWMAAARLGHSDVFRSDDRFESPLGSHLPFILMGFRGAVLITDPSYGGDEPPGTHANSEDDTEEHCSPQSLATVGEVTLEALDRIGERLAKIDRFAKKPAPPPPPPAPSEAPPEPEPTAAQSVPSPSPETPPSETPPEPTPPEP